jgi:hypothetical protein
VLLALDNRRVKAIGERWAAIMSTPDYTDSVSGDRLSNGWNVEDAIDIIEPIHRLAQQMSHGQGMYLLVE